MKIRGLTLATILALAVAGCESGTTETWSNAAGEAWSAKANTPAANLYWEAIRMQSAGGDLDAAQKKLEDSANMGFPEAMDRLGDMYRDGDGGAIKDFSKALVWYHKEADFGDAHPGQGAAGMISIAEGYEKGLGSDKDAAKADEWFDKAFASANIGALQPGNGTAIDCLGYLYYRGKGVQADPVKAWELFLKASEMGVSDAMMMVATMYGEGTGLLKPDPSAAFNWHMRVATSEDGPKSGAMLRLAEQYEFGNGIGRDEKEAMMWAQKAVDAGSSVAKRVLAQMYADDWGTVDKDLVKSMALLRQAAAQGDENAMTLIGEMYLQADGVKQDVTEAASWFTKAAESPGGGEPKAMMLLGRMYRDGLGVPKDSAQSFSWTQKSAEMQYPAGMNQLGEMYEAGDQVERNLKTAMDLYVNAANMGYPQAMVNVGRIYLGRGDAQPTNDPEQNANYKLAVDWFSKAAALGNIEATRSMGALYESGKGVHMNGPTALEWYGRAAEGGNVEAMRSLGAMLLYGRINSTDYQEAIKWLQKAVDNKNSSAMADMGVAYEKGWGVSEDYAIALDWYNKSAEADNPMGMEGIGRMFHDGLGVARNYTTALIWYRKAASLGYAPAIEDIARMYEWGEGVTRDMTEARNWYKQAMDHGSESAQKWINDNPPPAPTRPGLIDPTTMPLGRSM